MIGMAQTMNWLQAIQNCMKKVKSITGAHLGGVVPSSGCSSQGTTWLARGFLQGSAVSWTRLLQDYIIMLLRWYCLSSATFPVLIGERSEPSV